LYIKCGDTQNISIKKTYLICPQVSPSFPNYATFDDGGGVSVVKDEVGGKNQHPKKRNSCSVLGAVVLA
jgi:hypothetical protein